MCFPRNFEWFMRLVATSYFNWGGLGCWKYPTSSIYMCLSMNFEWFMRIVYTSHFDWVAIPHTVCEGEVASTVGTKDPLSSDECNSSGKFEPYPLLSVSKISAVCMLSLLYVQSGMSSMHVCVVYPVRTQDSVELGVRSILVAAYVLCYEFWMIYEVCVLFSLWVAIPKTVCNGVVVASTVETKDPLSSDECSWSGRSEPYPLLSVSKINAVCMLSLLWVRSEMSSIHVCVVYSVRTQDSVVMGVGSTVLPAYVLP